MARVFLSHTTADDAVATQIRDSLVERGHEVFVDHDLSNGILLGDEWERRLHERLGWAEALVCIVSPPYLTSPWCSAEIGAARARGTRIVPLSTESGLTHPLLGFLQHADLAVDADLSLRKLVETLRRLDEGVGAGWTDDRSPYPGLRPYDIDLHLAFFGRGAEISQQLDVLRSAIHQSDHAMALVVGPSGCGKSSLLRAGVVPALAEEPGWWCLPPVLPGNDPYGALAREFALAGHRAGAPWSVAETRRRMETDGLARTADELLAVVGGGRAGRMLITLDQYDEVLTLADATERAAFAGLVRGAEGSAVQFVATLRADFLDAVLTDPALGTIATRVMPLRPLSRHALREVVEGPARLARIRVESPLVDRLVMDTGDGEALPLLAYTLQQLAQGLDQQDVSGRALSMERYDALGGVQGALVSQADTALHEAMGVNGRSAEQVVEGLLRLVTVDDKGRPARQRVARVDLPEAVAKEYDAFIAHRLLASDASDRGPVIGVAHEAFLSGWPPLAQALEARSTALRARSQIEQTAEEWNQAGRPHTRLWERGQLAVAVGDVGASVVGRLPRQRRLDAELDLSGKAQDFLLTSIRQDRRRRRRAATVLSALLALALIAGGLAIVQQRRAQDQQVLAVSRQLMAQADSIAVTDPQTALRLGIAAQRVRPGPGTSAALVSQMVTSPYVGSMKSKSPIEAAAVSPDGRIMATSGLEGRVLLWRIPPTGVPQQLGELASKQIGGQLTFSPDGAVLATSTAMLLKDGSFKQGVQLWDVRNPSSASRVADLIPVAVDHISRIVFSPDGTMLAVGDSPQADSAAQVSLWDMTDRGRILRMGDPVHPGGRIRLMQFDKNGKFLVTASGVWPEGWVRRWNVQGIKHRELGKPLRYDSIIAFHPGTGLLATGSGMSAKELHLTRLRDPAAPRRMGTVRSWSVAAGDIREFVFSPNGKSAMTASTTDGIDSRLELWDVRNPAHPTPVRPKSDRWGISYLARVDSPRRIVLTDDPGVAVAITGDDHQLTRWDFSDPRHPQQVGGPVAGGKRRSPLTVVFPDGRVAQRRPDGALDVWDLAGPVTPRPTGYIDLDTRSRDSLPGGDRVEALVALPPAGSVALGLANGEVQVWKVADTRAPRQVSRFTLLTGNRGSVAFSPDGTAVAVTDMMRLVVANVADPARVGTILPPHVPGRLGDGLVGPVAFWPTGDRLGFVSGLLGGSPVIYDTSSPAQPRGLSPALHSLDLPTALAISGDGRVLATAGKENVILYDVTDPAHPVQRSLIQLEGQGVASLGLSPDGNTLVTGTNNDSSIVLWDISDLASPKRVALPLTDHAKEVTAIAYSPDAATLASADTGGTVMLWDMTDPHRPLRLGEPLKLHVGGVNALTFSKDSSLLFTAGRSPTVRIVDVKGLKDLRANAVDIACSHAGGGLTEDQWADFLPGLPYRDTCAR